LYYCRIGPASGGAHTQTYSYYLKEEVVGREEEEDEERKRAEKEATRKNFDRFICAPRVEKCLFGAAAAVVRFNGLLLFLSSYFIF
jgi:hypothetical protein